MLVLADFYRSCICELTRRAVTRGGNRWTLVMLSSCCPWPHQRCEFQECSVPALRAVAFISTFTWWPITTPIQVGFPLVFFFIFNVYDGRMDKNGNTGGFVTLLLFLFYAFLGNCAFVPLLLLRTTVVPFFPFFYFIVFRSVPIFGSDRRAVEGRVRRWAQGVGE